MDDLNPNHLVSVAIADAATKVLKAELTAAQILELEWHLTHNPTDGELISGTGGCRKLRWVAQGRGKRGGVRVIHYYLVGDKVVILKAYAKNVQANITQREKAELWEAANFLKKESSNEY